MSPLSRALTLGLALALPAMASAAEYRLLTTADGRVLPCEILATEAAGMRVSMPQGEMLVPFNMLRDMVPLTSKEYQEGGTWTVYIPTISAHHDALYQAVSSIQGVRIIGEPGASAPLTAQQDQAAAECGDNLTCVAAATASAPWMWLLMASEEGNLRAALNTGATSKMIRLDSMDPASLRAGVAEALELGSANEIEALSSGKPAKPGRDRNTGESLAFLPVPGLSNLRAGDTAGFGLAWAAVLPATALWVGAVGKGSQSLPETAILGVAGFYAITVVANHALEGRAAASDRTTVGVSPTEDGGASVMVSVPLR